MRKVEYLHLARIIRAQVDRANRAADSATEPESLRQARATLRTMEELAHEFARYASVDRAVFLNECGV